MLDILTRIYNLILPPHVSSKAVAGESPETFIRLFTTLKIPGGLALSAYPNQVVQAAITANKFHCDTHASLLLATLLNKYLERFKGQAVVLVPVPLSSQRQSERGYNQVQEILVRVVAPARVTLTLSPLLIRPLHTPPQTSLKRQERLKNVQAAFAVQSKVLKNLPEYVHIIIVDDVSTTGATLIAAASTLRKSLGENQTLECVALAH